MLNRAEQEHTVESDTVVKRALELGFMPYGENASNRIHFHWYKPDSDLTLSIQWRKTPLYTVGNQTTTYAPRAIQWLNWQA